MYYSARTYFYQNGSFVRAGQAGVGPFSQTLHYGYGVFEGLRSYQTAHGAQIFRPAAHFDRMRRAAERLGLPFGYTNAELLAVANELLEINKLKDAYIRPVLLAGEQMALNASAETRLFMAAWRWPKLLGSQPLRVCVSGCARPHPQAVPCDGKIVGAYVTSILANTEAKQRGYDEAILLDFEGQVAQAPGTNIFIEKDGQLITPPLGRIMPGITRATILDLAEDLGIPTQQRHFGPAELRHADAAMLVGTASEVAGILAVDGQGLAKKFGQTQCRKLADAYAELVLSYESMTII
jgi:branched-chain amino acid aminotransferase